MPDISGLGGNFALTNAGTGTAAQRREPDEEFEVIDALDLKEVKLGRQGENNTQNVQIDCSDWLTDLPGCQLMVVARRPGESELYVPQISVAAGVVTWPILSQDTALAGWGRAEVRGLLNGKIKKSCVFRTRIEPSLDGDGSPNPPTPPDWATEVINSVAVSTELVEQAEELVEEATATAIYAVRYDTNQSLTDAQKATARGNAAAAEDVIEEPGRNLFYLTAGAHTAGGLTFTLNDDGSFNVTSGGSAISATRLVPIMGCTSQTNYVVPAGTYIFNYVKSNETAAANFTLRWYDANNTGGTAVTLGTPFTLANASALVLRFGSGNAYGGTYHCELEAGSVLHRYVPAKKSAVDTVARADAEYAAAGVDRLDGAVAQVADDLAEFENTTELELAQVESGLAGKVEISQGAAQAGKALVIGEDGNVTTGEAGIPDAVKDALLDLLEHVAWADGDGQTYYHDLAVALNGGVEPPERWKASWAYTDGEPTTKGFEWASNTQAGTHTLTAGGLEVTGFSSLVFPEVAESVKKVCEAEFSVKSFAQSGSPAAQYAPIIQMRSGIYQQVICIYQDGFYIYDENSSPTVKIANMGSIGNQYKVRAEMEGEDFTVTINDTLIGTYTAATANDANLIRFYCPSYRSGTVNLTALRYHM